MVDTNSGEAQTDSAVTQHFPALMLENDQHAMELLAKAQTKHDIFMKDSVVAAILEATKAHKTQILKDGCPYIEHCVGTALLLAEIGADDIVIIAAILHDTMRHTEMRYDYMTNIFGHPVADLVVGVSKLSLLSKISRRREEDLYSSAGEMHNLLLAMADVRAVLIKLADRLNQMTRVEALSPEKQLRFATETLHIFAPLAGRIGIQEWKDRLQELCMKCLHKQAYDELVAELNAEPTLSSALAELKQALAEANFPYICLDSRQKSIYGIYQKMAIKDVPLDKIRDVYGLRIIVNDEAACYEAQNIVKSLWCEDPEFHKDYIRHPKENGYRSLHVIVKTQKGKTLEVQVRTQAMHTESDMVHWKYKETGGTDHPSHVNKMVEWARWLIQWQVEVNGSKGGNFERGRCPFPSHQNGCPYAALQRPLCSFPNEHYSYAFPGNMPLYVVVIDGNKMKIEELPKASILKDLLVKTGKGEQRMTLNGNLVTDFQSQLRMGDILQFQ